MAFIGITPIYKKPGKARIHTRNIILFFEFFHSGKVIGEQG